MPFSYLSHLECARCGARRDADVVNNLCHCGSPLLARYDLAAARDDLTTVRFAGRPPSLWRYHELLPVRDPARVVSLGEGMTPLVPLARLGRSIGVPGLLMKDEGLIPTGTFKARGAAVGVSRAAELGATGVAMPTNGNAGGAWSLYAARAGLRAVVAMPAGAPAITMAECVVAGAELHLVRGHIGDAARVIDGVLARAGAGRLAQAAGAGRLAPAAGAGRLAPAAGAGRLAPAAGAGRLLDASTLKEPYRVEGKKTMAYEIAEQLGWRCPDVIVYPTGGGVGLIGIHKALHELRELGWIGGALPRLVAVQAAGCAPVVRAFRSGAAAAEPWTGPSTVAFGLAVPKPLGDFLILDAIRDTKGTAVAVDDDAILAEQAACARMEGAFACPEGAAAVAAVRRLRADGWLGERDEVVVLNTGTGLKYPDTVRVDAPAIDPPA